MWRCAYQSWHHICLTTSAAQQPGSTPKRNRWRWWLWRCAPGSTCASSPAGASAPLVVRFSNRPNRWISVGFYGVQSGTVENCARPAKAAAHESRRRPVGTWAALKADTLRPISPRGHCAADERPPQSAPERLFLPRGSRTLRSSDLLAPPQRPGPALWLLATVRSPLTAHCRPRHTCLPSRRCLPNGCHLAVGSSGPLKVNNSTWPQCVHLNTLNVRFPAALRPKFLASPKSRSTTIS